MSKYDRLQVTTVTKAAKAMSAKYGCTVWYFRKGNNEGFIKQRMCPTSVQMGFGTGRDAMGILKVPYVNGKINRAY